MKLTSLRQKRDVFIADVATVARLRIERLTYKLAEIWTHIQTIHKPNRPLPAQSGCRFVQAATVLLDTQTSSRIHLRDVVLRDLEFLHLKTVRYGTDRIRTVRRVRHVAGIPGQQELHRELISTGTECDRTHPYSFATNRSHNKQTNSFVDRDYVLPCGGPG